MALSIDHLLPVASLEDVAIAFRSGDCPQIAGAATFDEVHVRRKRAPIVWRNHQVEVVRHQAVGKELDRKTLAGLSQQNEKVSVINVFEKNGPAVVATIYNVQHTAGRDDIA